LCQWRQWWLKYDISLLHFRVP